MESEVITVHRVTVLTIQGDGSTNHNFKDLQGGYNPDNALDIFWDASPKSSPLLIPLYLNSS